ncbi:MAG: hypothetical protein NZL85_05775, partial [Fimbriimonadales bacterium]|nr:hypothetical protein [Fimbriimonadales bacterium]
GNLPTIQSLCCQLDGIPLALELAAARLGTLTPAQMLARIDERLRWLKACRHDIEARHRTMQGVLMTTVALLPRAVRRLLAQLSLLPDSWMLEHASAVTGTTTEWLEEGLAMLCDACLIERVADAPPRYRMLELVREYAQSLLGAGQRRAAENRLCAWMVRTALAHAADACTPRLPHWLAFWDATRPLLLQTLDILEQRGKLRDALRLMRATERYFYLRPLHEDALNRLQRWLDSGRLSSYDTVEGRLMQMRLLVETGQFHRTPPVTEALRRVDRRDPRRGWALFWIVRAAMALNDAPVKQRYWRQLRKRYPCADDPHLHFTIHYLLPYLDPVEDILAWRESGVQLARRMGDPLLLGYAIEALIEPLIFFGEYTRALHFLDEVHRLYTQLGDALHLHRVQHGQAVCYLQLGELARAQPLLDGCAEQERALGLSPFYTRWLQVQLWRWQGELAHAQQFALAEAAALELQGDGLGAASMLEQAALCAREQGDLEAALRHGADAQRLWERSVPPDQERPKSLPYLYLRACAGDAVALQELEEQLQRYRQLRWRPVQAVVLQYLAEAYAIHGDAARATHALQEAIQLNQAMGRALALQKCRNLPQNLPDLDVRLL